MDYAQEFNITVEVPDTFRWSKTYYGTQSGAAIEAMDFMNQKVLEYIHDNNITDPDQQEELIEMATNTISWENNYPIVCYVLLDDVMPIGVFYDLADAEEMFFAHCDETVYNMLMDSDPRDVFGEEEFDYYGDYWYLMKDAASDMCIKTVPVWGLDERYD